MNATMVMDRRRVLRHLTSVAGELGERPTDDLDPGRRQRRAAMLEELNRYRAAGLLPQNTYVTGRSPVFIDDAGRHCAVAHLIAASGHEVLTTTTRARSNLARIEDMNDPALAAWADRHGLTVSELARIQPTYYVVDAGATALILSLVAASAAALGTALLGLARTGRAWARTAVGASVVGAILLAAAILTSTGTDPCANVQIGECFVPWTGARRAVDALAILAAIVAVAWIRRARIWRRAQTGSDPT